METASAGCWLLHEMISAKSNANIGYFIFIMDQGCMVREIFPFELYNITLVPVGVIHVLVDCDMNDDPHENSTFCFCLLGSSTIA